VDDKILVQIDAMLAQMIESLGECRQALIVMGAVSPEASGRNTSVTTNSRSLREAAGQQYMSGRWHRRDGDIYGIQTQRLKAPADVKDADSTPGNIRPPDER